MKYQFPTIIIGVLAGAAPFAFGQAASTIHADKVVGYERCEECHEEEVKAWKLSSHARSNNVHQDAKTREKAQEIASKMGLANASAMSTSPLCTECHYTRQETGGATKTISGVSCESCHGGGKDFYEVHGDKEKIPSREERQKLSKAAGMLYPHDTALVAENCFNCHIIRDEKLVNVGGHPARSKGFNLVSWTQGEVRHNFYTPDHERTKGKNLETVQSRKRKLFVVGMLLDLEYSLRSLSKGRTGGGEFRKAMGTRANTIIKKELPAVIKGLGGDGAPAEILEITKIADGVKLSGDPAQVAAAADAIKPLVVKFSEGTDGSNLGGVDGFLPPNSKGKAWQP